MLIFWADSKSEYNSQLGTLRKAFVYLALFETTVHNILDVIITTLILNGHDCYILKREFKALSEGRTLNVVSFVSESNRST